MNAIAEHIPAAVHTAMAVPAPQQDALIVMMERALTNPDISVEKLNSLIDMRMKWDDKQRANAREDAAEDAKRQFAAAMATFKQKAPTILKKHHVKYENSTGGFTEYDHAKLADVCEAVIVELATVGITHDWIPRQDQARIFVECVLTHVAGHTKSVTMNAAPDATGGKNAIQAIASATSYLERYTLLAVSGLATKDMDDDGRGTDPATASNPTPRELPPLPAGHTAEGYQKWAADLRAKSDEGRVALMKAWKGSKEELRAYMCKHESKRWDEMKKHSERAKS
jgi:hypothetical protein